MATVVAAMIARARRDIQHYFFSEDAVQPDRAIRFEPRNRIQRRQFDRMLSRGIIVFFIVVFLVLIRMAWKRNRYDDYAGFVEVTDTPLGTPPSTTHAGAV